jgi:hypothetical protein
MGKPRHTQNYPSNFKIYGYPIETFKVRLVNGRKRKA